VSTASPNSSQHPRAFTLLEVVISVAILSIIGVSLMSVMTLTARAVPAQEDPDVALAASQQMVTDLANDIASATAITLSGSKTIRLRVADRTGDSIDEEIVYSWSGNDGDSLRWRYNGSAWMNLAESIKQFDIQLDNREATRQVPGPDVWGSEVLLAGSLGAMDSQNEILGGNGVSQYFEPLLPENANGWTITRVELSIRRRSGATQPPVFTVSAMKRLANGWPDFTAIQTATVNATTISSSSTFQTISVPFAGAPTYAVGIGMSIVLSPSGSTNSSNAGEVGMQTFSAAPNSYCATTDNFLLWDIEPEESIGYRAYGKIRVPSTQPQTYLRNTAVTITFQQGGAAPVTVSARSLNHPEVQ
jgi:prepilin-type N-terminal cleavage/methylation domain-containing protein